MLGVCEQCGSEFGSRLSGQDAEAEMKVAFDAHNCALLDSSQNALRVARWARNWRPSFWRLKTEPRRLANPLNCGTWQVG